MSLKCLFRRVGIFLAVLFLGVLFTLSHSYTLSTTLEKEMVKVGSQRIGDILEKWRSIFLQERAEGTQEKLNRTFNTEVKLTKDTERNIDLLRGSISEVYSDFKEGIPSKASKECINRMEESCESYRNMSEEEKKYLDLGETCESKESIKKECEQMYISQFPLGLATTTFSLTLQETINQLTGTSQRIDTRLSEVLLTAGEMTQQAILATYLQTETQEYMSQRIGNTTNLTHKELKQRYYNASLHALKRTGEVANKTWRNVSVSEMSLSNCARYLPIKQSKDLETYLKGQMKYAKNPYLRFIYAAKIKTLENCTYNAYEKVKDSSSLCYRPETASTAVKSIGMQMKTNSILMSCSSTTLKNILENKKMSGDEE